jgi:galactonate dehydratase
VLQLGAAAILQMNVARVGGLLEPRRSPAWPRPSMRMIAPHLYNGPVGAAASIQLSAATPNFLIHEAIMDFGGFHGEVLKTKLQFDDGYLIPSREPGLGIELNLDVSRSILPIPATACICRWPPTLPTSRNSCPPRAEPNRDFS